jgi:hypothetical protein
MANTETEMSIGNNAVAIPLPKTVADLMASRKGRFDKTLNDYVEEIHLRLWEDPKYKELLDAVTDGDAIEGSLVCDDHEAARMIREYALKNNSPIKDKKLASFKMALRIVMRRYRMTRTERAVSLHGEPVIAEAAE